MAIAKDARSSIYFRKKRGWWDLAYYFPVGTFTKWNEPDASGRQTIAYSHKYVEPQWAEMRRDFKRGVILRPSFAVASSALILAILVANHRASPGEAPLALGAIAFDAHTTSAETSGTSKTTNHTASGSNSLIVADTFLDGTNSDLLTGLTWNSNNMTVVDKVGKTTPTGYCYAYQYANGTADGSSHACVATYSATGAHGLEVTSYTGVSQSAPIDSHANFSQSAEASPHNFTTTVVASSCWLHAYVFVFAGGESAGTGTTQRSNPDSNRFILDSNGTVGTGSQSLQLTGIVESYAGVVFSIAPKTTLNTLNISENVSNGILESTTRAWVAPRGLSIDRLTITESMSSLKSRIVIILESLGVIDSVSRSVQWTRAFIEQASIIEIFSRIWSHVINALETISILEFIMTNKVLSIIIKEIVPIIEYVRFPLNWLKRIRPSTLWTPRTKP